jgi:hypothetical protein
VLRYQLCAVCVRRPLRCTLRSLHCCDVLRCAPLCIAVQGAEAVQFAAQLDIVHGAPSVSLFRGGAVAAELARQPDLPRRGTLYIRMVNVGRKYDRPYTAGVPTQWSVAIYSRRSFGAGRRAAMALALRLTAATAYPTDCCFRSAGPLHCWLFAAGARWSAHCCTSGRA